MKTPILLTEGTKAVRDGTLKPSEWASQCVEVIERLNGSLKAWSYFDADAVMSAAKAMDKTDWAKEKPFPMLAGAPLGVKDIFNTVDHPNSMGSPTRAGYWPGNDARVVTQAKFTGAQILGKTTTAEFAVHTPPDTINPWHEGYIAGTSSTGTAVAVATGMVPAALGTQSAGSIARPASYNGVVGFKPSFGVIPRTGVLKTCDTLDTIGWMTRSVADANLLLQALRVRSINYPMVERGFASSAKRFAGKTKWRVAMAKAPGHENVTEDSRRKVEEFALQLGNRPDVEIVELDLTQQLGTAHATHETIYDRSLAYYFQRELSQHKFISPIFQEIVERAKSTTPEMYFRALEEQEKLTRTVDSLMHETDILILPSTAGEAVGVDQLEPRDSSLIWTLTGTPAISLPLLKGPNGLPVGVTFVAAKYADDQLLDFAAKVMPGVAEIAVPVTVVGQKRKTA
jgi:Asp-tRNA(Asn)/Glu-tRNA(Gln) amidotransferase A subunit family amidase